MTRRLLLLLLLLPCLAGAQVLRIKPRKPNALGGAEFAQAIADSALSFQEREQWIYNEVISGNVPQSYRKLMLVTDTATIDGLPTAIKYYALPDYLAIGSDTDYFYCPLTPGMAQRIARNLKCSLPTRKMVDAVYRCTDIKLTPRNIPPSKAMITVPAFIKHNQMVAAQRDSLFGDHIAGKSVGGNKKDVVISSRIYNDTSTFHVVIYGWHRLNGKAVQPLYAKHLNNWADYSHGIRLVQNTVWVNGKKTSIEKVLRSEKLSRLLSDEGKIDKPYYPEKTDYDLK